MMAGLSPVAADRWRCQLASQSEGVVDQRDLIDAGLTEDREMSWTELGRRMALCRTTVMRE